MPNRPRNPTKQNRDNQRSKLYKAEGEAFEGFLCDELNDLTVDDCQAFINKIMHSRWFRSRYGTHQPPRVKSGKGARWATARYRERSIVLPLWARKPWVMLHELAHYAVRWTDSFAGADCTAHHGPEFAKEYLALVRRWIGKEEADALRAAYKKNRVKYRVG